MKLYEEIELTDECLNKAIEYSKDRVYKRSMRGEEGTRVGAIGEAVLVDYLRDHNMEVIDKRKSTRYDLLVNNKRVEVKTKDRTVAPKPFYECSVPSYNHSHQIPDWFYFISLYREGKVFKKAYLLGGMTYQQLSQEGVKMNKGEVDERNGWLCRESCININIEKLISNSMMLEILNDTQVHD